MTYQSRSKDKLPSEVLKKFASVMTGKQSKHLTRPFADTRFVALKQWCEEVMGINKETHPYFFKLVDARINLSEVENINKVSETTKLNLHISDSLKDQNVDQRGALFDL